MAASNSERRAVSVGELVVVVVGMFGGDPVVLGMECPGNWWGDGPREDGRTSHADHWPVLGAD